MTQRYKGRGVVQITGRNSGKNFSQAAITRLIEDLANRPVEELVLSEGRVYGAIYHCVQPIGGHWFDMEAWCHQTYGPSSTSPIWGEARAPEPAERWYMNNRTFWFRDEKDRTIFILKWS